MSNYDHFWKIFRLFLLRSPGLWVIRAAVFHSSLDGSKNGTADYHCKKIILPEWNELRLIRGLLANVVVAAHNKRKKREEFFGTAQLSQIEVYTHTK